MATKFMLGKRLDNRKIRWTRPIEFERQKGRPMAPVRAGSSTGKLITTHKGIIRTSKAMDSFLEALQEIFRLDDSYGGRKLAQRLRIKRTITTSITPR